MGASGWVYFCEYQADLSAALASLRTSVFGEGAYYCPSDIDRASITSIEQLQEACAEDGTHSILDISLVSDAPAATTAPGMMDLHGFSTVFPLSEARRQALFGSPTPTRAQVEAVKDELMDELGRWQGCYVVFEDASGKGICFAGHSGD